MNLNFEEVTQKLEVFLADDDLSFFAEKASMFMERNLNQDMTLDEAIDLLEKEFLFNETKNKSDILVAADLLRAIRMCKFEHEKQEDEHIEGSVDNTG